MRLLVESYPFIPELVEEREVTTVLGTEKRLRVGGPFQAVERKNDNSRVYPRPVFEEVLSEGSQFKDRLKNRRVFGEMEHPKDGVSNLNRYSHIVDDVHFGKEDLVIGEATIFNIPRTLVLKEVFAVGGQLPVSSRGRGETMTRSDGLEEVQHGYELDTFDFVATPSVGAARTDALKEAAEAQKGTGVVGKSLRDTLDRVRAVYLSEASDIVSLTEALIVLRPITQMGERKLAKEAVLLDQRIGNRIREKYGTDRFYRPAPAKVMVTPARAVSKENRLMSKSKDKELVEALLGRYMRLKESHQAMQQRYGALSDISDALVRRCRAAEVLAESLLVEARKRRKEAATEKKKGKACESISAELLRRYHKDGAALFTEGFSLGHPEAAKIKGALKECRNAHQAMKIARELSSVALTETRVQRPAPERAQGILTETHPSRLPTPNNWREIQKLEEAAKASRCSEEPNLISAFAKWERGGR